MGLSDSETIRLFKELGSISSKLDGLKDSLDAHEVLDIERFRNIERAHVHHDKRLNDLEEADITGQHDNFVAVKQKADALEARASAVALRAEEDKRAEATEQRKVRAATIRTAITLCVGGLITIGTGLVGLFIARALGLK